MTLQIANEALGDPRPLSEADVLRLHFNDETVSFIVLCLTAELHHAASLGEISQMSVEENLAVVLSVLNGNSSDLLNVSGVLTPDAPCVARIDVGFSYPGYRRLAGAAKNRAASIVHGD